MERYSPRTLHSSWPRVRRRSARPIPAPSYFLGGLAKVWSASVILCPMLRRSMVTPAARISTDSTYPGLEPATNNDYFGIKASWTKSTIYSAHGYEGTPIWVTETPLTATRRGWPNSDRNGSSTGRCEATHSLSIILA